MASSSRLLRSGGFLAVLVPYSSSLARALDGADLDGASAPLRGRDVLFSDLCPREGVSSFKELLLAAAAAAGGGSVSSADCDFLLLNISATRFGGAPPCLSLDGLVVNPPVCCACIFSGGLAGAGKPGSCAVFSDAVPTEEEKQTFQLLQFDLQRKHYLANSKAAYLNLRQVIVEAEGCLNEGKSKVIEEKDLQLKEGEALLEKRSLDFERRMDEEKKLDEVLVIVKGIASVAKNAEASKVGSGNPPETGKQSAQATSSKLSCRVYHYSKGKIVDYAVSRGPVDHLLNVARNADRFYTICRKYYPIVFGGVAWYTYGMEASEAWDLMNKMHIDNKTKYNKLVSDYRHAKKEAKEAAEAAAAKAEADRKAAEEEKKASSGDHEDTSSRRWFYLWLK